MHEHLIKKNLQEKKKTLPTLPTFLHMRNRNPGIYFFGLSMKHGTIAKVACDVTLSVYPHRASLKNMPDHGGNQTYNLWNTRKIMIIIR